MKSKTDNRFKPIQFRDTDIQERFPKAYLNFFAKKVLQHYVAALDTASDPGVCPICGLRECTTLQSAPAEYKDRADKVRSKQLLLEPQDLKRILELLPIPRTEEIGELRQKVARAFDHLSH